MSTLTEQRGDTVPNLDGASDLKPAPETSLIIERQVKPTPKVESKKTTTTKK